MDKLYIPNVRFALYRQTFKGWKIPTRKIIDQEFVLIESGKGKIKIESEIIDVKENDLIYFTPETKHSLWVEKEPFMAFHGVHFSFNDANERLILPYVSSLKNTFKLKRLFNELRDDYLGIGYLNNWKLSITLQTIILEVLNDIYLQTSPINIKRINDLVINIKNNPSKEYTLENLCKLSNLKKSQLIVAFKEVTGLTPMKYVNYIRLEKSKLLLISSDMKIKDIAFLVGFNDELFFSRQFKNSYGISPKQLRSNFNLSH